MEDNAQYISLDAAPMPIRRTLRRRRNPLFQLIRFAALNLKMIRVIRKGHG